MANATNFYSQILTDVRTLIQTLENLNTDQDRLASDATLAAATATVATNQGNALSATDINNVAVAINQLLFTFNSGSPTQKSYLYKLL
jgi:hypothetical protein